MLSHRTPELQQQHTDSQPHSQEQLPGQSQHPTSKSAPGSSQDAAQAAQNGPLRQQSSLKLQDRTGLPPHWGGAQNDKGLNQATAAGGQQQQKPWYQLGGSAVVKEAVKVRHVQSL